MTVAWVLFLQRSGQQGLVMLSSWSPLNNCAIVCGHCLRPSSSLAVQMELRQQQATIRRAAYHFTSLELRQPKMSTAAYPSLPAHAIRDVYSTWQEQMQGGAVWRGEQTQYVGQACGRQRKRV